MPKSMHWENWLGVLLGMWLFVTPLVLGYAGNRAAGENALVMATVLVALELLDMGAYDKLGLWLDVAAGVWLCLSPYALGFASTPVAANTALAVGLLVLVITLCAASPLDAAISRWWHSHALKL